MSQDRSSGQHRGASDRVADMIKQADALEAAGRWQAASALTYQARRLLRDTRQDRT